MMNKSVLANGVRILTEPMPQVLSATIGIWVENGSRYEQPDENGVSHFHRASALQGHQETHRRADRRSDRRSRRRAQRLHRQGIHLLLRQSLGRGPRTGDRYPGRHFSRLAVRAGRNRPRAPGGAAGDLAGRRHARRLYPRSFQPETYWAGHPLALPIFGSVRTVNAINRELLTSFMAERYRAGRVFIAAAGMVDHDALVKRLRWTVRAARRRRPSGSDQPTGGPARA